MNASQLRSKVPLASTGTDADQESNEEQDTATDEQSGSLRRKLVVGAAVLGIVMYVRRRRSRSGNSKTAISEDEASAETQSAPEQPSKQGGGIGRRLKVMVISTLVFALARWIVRRFRSSR